MASPVQFDELVAAGSLSAGAAVAVVQGNDTFRTTPRAFITEAETYTNAGSGSGAARSVQTELRELVFNIKSGPYGAVGDDATDNTTAIQNAVNAASSAGGGIVFIPYGTFRTGQIALASNVTIMGAGWGSVLKLKNSGNNYVLSTTNAAQYRDNIAIKNLTIDGNKANNTSGGGIQLNGRNNEVSGCYIYDTVEACILINVPSNGASDTPLAGAHRIVNNYCKNPGKSGNLWGAIAVTHGSNVVIAGNICESTDGEMTYGIDVEPESGNTIDDIHIIGNIVKGGRIFADCSNLASPGTNISIVGNRVDARGSAGATSENIAPVYVRNVTGFLCSDNHLIGHADGIRGGVQIQAGLTNFAITNNLIVASEPASGAGYAIRINNTAGTAVNGSICGNTLIAAETVTFGIYADATGPSGVKVCDNTIIGFTQPYYLQPTDMYVTPPINPGVSADNGDASVTLSSNTSLSTQVWDTPLTSTRTVTLNRLSDSPNSTNGAKFRIIRTANATGASALNVGSGPLKALAVGQWCVVELRGNTWILAGFGSL